MQGILHSVLRGVERITINSLLSLDYYTSIEQPGALQFQVEILVIVERKKCQIEKLELCIQRLNKAADEQNKQQTPFFTPALAAHTNGIVATMHSMRTYTLEEVLEKWRYSKTRPLVV